jgi:hypothetical protein
MHENGVFHLRGQPRIRRGAEDHGQGGSRLIPSDCGVKVLEFYAGILRCEVPVCFCVIGITVVFPGGDLVDEGLFIRDAPVEALAG